MAHPPATLRAGHSQWEVETGLVVAAGRWRNRIFVGELDFRLEPRQRGRPPKAPSNAFVEQMWQVWEALFDAPVPARSYLNRSRAEGGDERPTAFQQMCFDWLATIDPEGAAAAKNRPKNGPIGARAFRVAKVQSRRATK